MYDAVIVGSMAAKLGGFLPPWREGWVGDVDLICTPVAAQQIAHQTGQVLQQHVPGRAMLRAGPLWLDLEITDKPPTQWAGELQLVALNDCFILTRVGSPALVAALRAYSVGFVPTRMEKALRDVGHYDTMAQELDIDLLRFIEMRRRKRHAEMLQDLHL